MRRRDLLRGVTVVAAASATAGFSPASPASPPPLNPLGKIALEEHFIIPEFVEYFAASYPNIDQALIEPGLANMQDLGDKRLSIMDQNHIDYVVLSIGGSGVQVEKDAAVAIKRSRLANDFLAKEVQKRPRRYGGFAHLSMHNPVEASNELERCIRDLKFHGALINGHTNGEYLDLDKYSVFWERAAALHAPIYIHPTNPIDHPSMYSDHPELWGPVCSWAFETGTHALRLVFAGVFERYPTAKLILGHMGETLPISLWRYDSRWPVSHRSSLRLPHDPSFYIKRNIAVTTSGVCADSSLRCALEALGSDSVMFSVDYPFEKTEVAAQFIENAKIAETDRVKVASGNSKAILHIDHSIGG